MSGDEWGRGPAGPPRRGVGPPRRAGGAPPPRPPPLSPAAADPPLRPPDRPPVRTVRRPDRRPVERRPRRRGGVGRRLFVLLVVLLVAVVGFLVWVDTKLNHVAALPATSAGSGDGTNWLIVGSDSRQGLTAQEEKDLATGGDVGQRTDTIMLLHSGSSGAVLVSLPRDSFVDIPGRGRDKLNAAYAF